MGQATGGRAPAGSPVYVIYSLRGIDGDAGYLYFSEGIGSGQGARHFADGLNAIYFRDQKNYPVEFEEREFPLREDRTVRDQAGLGRARQVPWWMRSDPGRPRADRLHHEREDG